jgi:hypothetical protein
MDNRLELERLLSELRDHLAGAERVCQQLGDSQYALLGRQPMWMAIEQMRGGMMQSVRGWNLASWFLREHEIDLRAIEVDSGEKSHRDHSRGSDVPDAAEGSHGLLDKLARRGRRKG